MNSGQETLDWLYHTQLQIDDAWAIRDEHGFTWWPNRHAQRIEIVEEKELGNGMTGHLIRVSTDVLRDVALDDQGITALGAFVMPFAAMAAPVYDEEEKTLKLVSSAWVHSEVQHWLNPIISMAAVMQISEADAHAENLPTLIGGEADTSGHPNSGMRSTPDEIAGIAERLVIPMGQKPSRWTDEEFEEACDRFMQQPPCLMGNAGGGGFTAEFPYYTVSSMCQASTEDRHPRYGHGLLVRHQFPVSEEDEAALTRHAFDLNAADVANGQSDAYGFGSYCTAEGDIAFVSFFPNAIYRPGLVPNFYFMAAGRARFGAQELMDDDWSETWDEEGNCRAKPAVVRMMEELGGDL